MWFYFYFLLRQISFIPLNVTYGLTGKQRRGKLPDLQFYFSPENAEYSVKVNFITPSHMNITVTSEVKVTYKRIVKSKLCSLMEFDQSPSDDIQRIIFYQFAIIMINWSVALYLVDGLDFCPCILFLRKSKVGDRKFKKESIQISILPMITIRSR